MPFIKTEQIKLPCMSQEHYPPNNYYYQPGQRYTYKCPSCGEETVIEAPMVTC